MPDTIFNDVEFRLLPTDQLVPHARNVRRHVGDVSELAASIKSSGVHEPLIVQPNGQPDRWVILAGHRRHAAAKAAKLPTVPCLIRRDLDDVAQLALMLTENTQRAQLDPIEEADGVQGLLDLGLSDKAASATLGWSVSKVRRRKKIAALPDDVKGKVLADDVEVPMTLDDAEFLASVEHPADMKELVEALGTRNWATTRHMVSKHIERRKDAAAIHKAAKQLGIPSGDWNEYCAARDLARSRFDGRAALCVETHWDERTDEQVELAQSDDTVSVVQVTDIDGLWLGGRPSPAVLYAWCAWPDDEPAAEEEDVTAGAADVSPADTGAPKYPGAVPETAAAERERRRQEDLEERSAAESRRAAAARAEIEMRKAATEVRRQFISKLIIDGTVIDAQTLLGFALTNVGVWEEVSASDLYQYLPAAAAEASGITNPEVEMTSAAEVASAWFTGRRQLRVLAAAAAMTLIGRVENIVADGRPEYVDEDDASLGVSYLRTLEVLGLVLSDVEIAFRDALAVIVDGDE